MAGTSDSNPFVGPRPMEEGASIYGRTREVQELYDQLQARRIVLLHSPSGAGKSSLVQAGLIPRLRAARFDVWPAIRVNYTSAEPTRGANPYLLSAMLSLEGELPRERQRPEAELATLDFAAYVRSRPRRKGRAGQRVVLIFDQFEEILTTNPRAVAERRAFFEAVGRTLDDGDIWALFVIREDYLGALAPYRDLLPTQLYNTFRLDLLTRAGAAEVATLAAQDGDRVFEAVDALVDELAKVKVQLPDGSEVEEPGIYVEPVQLQVVCRRLWEAMPDDDRLIGADDVAAYADVATALAGYYDEAVLRAVDGDAYQERAVRAWVGERLIVGGIRTPVRRGVERSAGLSNVLIERLVDSYLVRTEQRGGATWYELSHDRLVAPVLEDNAAWDQKHLHPMQVQARLWSDGQRSPSLLLSAQALAGARAWAKENPTQITAIEADFIAQSLALRDGERRRHNRERAFFGAILMLFVAALGALGVAGVLYGRATLAQAEAVRAKDEADVQRRSAEQGQQEALAAKAEADRSQRAAEDAARAAQEAEAEARRQAGLATAAQRYAEAQQAQASRAEREAVASLIAAQKAEQGTRDSYLMQAVSTLAYDPAAALPFLARVEVPDALPDWDDRARELLSSTLPVNILRTGAPRGAEAIGGVGVSREHDVVVAATSTGRILAWHAERAGVPDVLASGLPRVRRLAVGPDGARVAWITDEAADRVGYGRASAWSAETGRTTPLVVDGAEGVYAIAFAADGTLVAAGSNGSVVMWGPGSDAAAGVVDAATLDERVFGLGFVGESRRLVIAGESRLWTVDTAAARARPQLLVQLEPGQYVKQTQVSRDGALVAVLSEAGRVFVAGLGDAAATLREVGETATALAFVGPDHALVVGRTNHALGYFASEGAADLARHEVPFVGHAGVVTSLAASGDGARFVSGSLDGSVRVWPARVLDAVLRDDLAGLAAEVKQRSRLLCIQAEDIVKFLGETHTLAQQQAQACATRRGL